MQPASNASPLRIVYAAGPGDVIGTYHHWAAGRDDPSQVAVTYSSQFYDFCRETPACGYVISSNKRKDRVEQENLIVEHRPGAFQRGPALLYHLGQVFWGLRLMISAIAFHADFVVVADSAHWFVLGCLPWVGIKIVPTLHCVLWPKQEPPISGVNRFIRRLNARFFRKSTSAILSLSRDITEQVAPMLNGKAVPIFSFLPTYRPNSFGEGFGPPPPSAAFRVFFAGRIERNKGVFDLLEIARGFGSDIEFDLCGDGSQIEALRTAADQAGLSDRFRLHGHSPRPLMMQLYERCNVVIVPTTSDFVEGFNKVVAEGVLAGRPVITSSVCPALEYVRDAVLEVPPDIAAGYGEAILLLKQNPTLYEAKRAAANQVRTQFYYPARGWKAALTRAVTA